MTTERAETICEWCGSAFIDKRHRNKAQRFCNITCSNRSKSNDPEIKKKVHTADAQAKRRAWWGGGSPSAIAASRHIRSLHLLSKSSKQATHCRRGHPLIPANIMLGISRGYISRRCLLCRLADTSHTTKERAAESAWRAAMGGICELLIPNFADDVGHFIQAVFQQAATIAATRYHKPTKRYAKLTRPVTLTGEEGETK